MIDLFGDHAADDAEVVGDACGVGEERGNFLTALAVFFKIGESAAGFEDRVLELGELLALGEAFGERLAVETFEFRFPVEAFEL